MLASNKRLKLTAPSVTLLFFSLAKGAFGPQLKRSVSQILDGGEEKELLFIRHWRMVRYAFR
jgi:hypothetical protein